MAELTKYEIARNAIADCHSVDEVKDIRDKAMAMRIYAKQAQDKTMETQALEIRIRAERRLGQMMKEQEKAPPGREPDIGLSKNPISERNIKRPAALAQAGIDKNLAHRARTLANMSPDEFETHITEAKTTGTIATKPKEVPEIPNVRAVASILHEVASNILKYKPEDLQVLKAACANLLLQLDSKEESVTWLSSRR